MGEEPAVLEDDADAPAVGRHVHAGGRVQQRPAVERDAAFRAGEQPGDRLNDRRLPRARRAEQGGHAARLGLQRDLEPEVSARMA